ncbi:type IV pilin protein [Thermodesulfobacteriota bacterium]
MNRQTGFTLIELMVVIAIVGILTATAIPGYNAYRQRARQAEATIIIKQLMDSQIAYFLDHEEFFPVLGGSLAIYHNTAPGDPEYDFIGDIYENLAIQLLPGRFLNYHLSTYLDADGSLIFQVTIESEGGFSIGGGENSVTYTLNDKGYVSDKLVL